MATATLTPAANTGDLTVATNDITSVDTTITLNADATTTDYYFESITPSATDVAYMIIDDEIMTVTGVAAAVITVTRGAFGTPPTHTPTPYTLHPTPYTPVVLKPTALGAGTPIGPHAISAVARAVEVCPPPPPFLPPSLPPSPPSLSPSPL